MIAASVKNGGMRKALQEVHGKLDAGEILKIFACSITEWASDTDSLIEAD